MDQGRVENRQRAVRRVQEHAGLGTAEDHRFRAAFAEILHEPHVGVAAASRRNGGRIRSTLRASPAATRVAVQFDGVSAINAATTRVLTAHPKSQVRDPSMRTLGGEVIRGRWGKSATDRSPSEPLAVHDVAVLRCCMASGVPVRWRGPSFRFSGELRPGETRPLRRSAGAQSSASVRGHAC